MMNVGRCAAEGTVRDCRMVHKIVLLVHDRTCAADEQQRIAVVQLPHLVRGQQFFATMSSDEFKEASLFHKKRTEVPYRLLPSSCHTPTST